MSHNASNNQESCLTTLRRSIEQLPLGAHGVPRVAELRAALKEADRDGKGSLDDHTLLGAFNKLGLGLSAQDMSTLLSKALISPKAPVDYEKFLQQLRERLSTAATIEEAEAEVVEALGYATLLRALHEQVRVASWVPCRVAALAHPQTLS